MKTTDTNNLNLQNTAPAQIRTNARIISKKPEQSLAATASFEKKKQPSAKMSF